MALRQTLETSPSSDLSKAAPRKHEVVQDWAAVNDRAAQIALRASGHLIVGITSSQRAAVQTAISAGLKAGWNDTLAQQAIAMVVGLDPRAAASLMNFQAGLVAQNVPPEQVVHRVRVQAEHLRARRAILIAETEVQNVLNQAQRDLWTEAWLDRSLPKGAVREWVLHEDERLCPICRPFAGKRASCRPNGQGYLGTNGLRSPGPGLHPLCRCSERLIAPTQKRTP